MVHVRVPRHRVTVVTNAARARATCLTNCLKTVCRRMRRPSIILLLGLTAVSALSVFLETADLPPPPPVPDQAATVLRVETLPRDDAVLAMERELEHALRRAHRPQIPAASSFDRRVDEAARVVAVHVKQIQD